MINGTTSRVLYIGAYLLLGLMIVCFTIIIALGGTVPGEMWALVSIPSVWIAGAHSKPPLPPNGGKGAQ